MRIACAAAAALFASSIAVSAAPAAFGVGAIKSGSFVELAKKHTKAAPGKCGVGKYYDKKKKKCVEPTGKKM